jgi:LemA protein
MLFPLIFLIALFAVSIFVIHLYNGLIRRRNDVKNAWSAIDVQLKRRHDLIPGILEFVKGYAAHERQTLDALTNARDAALASGGIAARAKTENALSASLRPIFALAEAYPNLKANESFIALQKELAATENKIGFARLYYNDTATRYKNRIEKFPGNMVAGIFHFRAEPFFQLEDIMEREVQQVRL